jgi:hypothetical protein
MPRATFEPLTCDPGLSDQRDGPALPALPSAGRRKPRTGNLIVRSNTASLRRPYPKSHGASGAAARSWRLWMIPLHRGRAAPALARARRGMLVALGGNAGGGGKLNDLAAHDCTALPNTSSATALAIGFRLTRASSIPS